MTEHPHWDHLVHPPGSRLDGQAQASYHAGATDVPQPDPEGLDLSRYVIHNRILTPTECIPRTQVLSAANPFLLLLPMDTQRWRSIVTAITNAIYLTETKELAQQIAAAVAGGQTSIDPRGAYLPVSVGYPLQHRAAMYAVVSTTASVSPVSVITERYAAAAPLA